MEKMHIKQILMSVVKNKCLAIKDLMAVPDL